MLAHMAGENRHRPPDAALNGQMAHPRSLCHREKHDGSTGDHLQTARLQSYVKQNKFFPYGGFQGIDELKMPLER
jgi:hypothetical protein